ncbi:MAG: class I SAM-dependent methyltransferase [Oscillospiraceae bacterium]|jgi:tRNA (adenine22-N1)-methyltransferase|nr:class I SAM-dependent methyltransferase [Oscillospiraceae bacterium]
MSVNLRAGGRLAEIASRVPFGARVLDVGCDHGFVPIHLASSGAVGAVFASDIRPGPLDSARRNAEERGVADKIRFFLADGVPPEVAGLIDTVIISGMGGETIAGILERAPETLGTGVFFILQPQTKREALLSYLTNNAFTDIRLIDVFEGRRKYIIITTRR